MEVANPSAYSQINMSSLNFKTKNVFTDEVLSFQSGELLKLQKDCSELTSEDKLVQTDIIHAQEALQRAQHALSDSWNKLRSRPHLRPFLDSILGMEKIMNFLKSNHQEVKMFFLK